MAGRVVVVTGGGQGIGREYARQFAAAGATVVIAEVDGSKAAGVAAEIELAGGLVMPVETDVGSPDSVAAMVGLAMAELGRIDVLINNAALVAGLAMDPFEDIDPADWNSVMRVNVTGAFLCAQAVAPHMRAAGWGRIINMMSGAVALGTPYLMHYVTSKAALVGMTNSMSRELGQVGITVNAIAPGVTFTEVPRGAAAARGKAAVVANQCIPRRGVPTDLVGLALFLSSAAAGFITGQTIACDGGLTLS